MAVWLIQFPANSRCTKVNNKSAVLVIANSEAAARAIAVQRIPESRAGWLAGPATDLSAWAVNEPNRGYLLSFGSGDLLGT